MSVPCARQLRVLTLTLATGLMLPVVASAQSIADHTSPTASRPVVTDASTARVTPAGTPAAATINTPAAVAPASGPQSQPVGIQRVAPMYRQFTTPDAPADNANMGPNVALMAVGGAGVVVGLLIGGDGGNAIALGGAVVGLVGLYRYLR